MAPLRAQKQQRDRRRKEQGAGEVQRVALMLDVLVQRAEQERRGGQPERNVHEEDPMP